MVSFEIAVAILKSLIVSTSVKDQCARGVFCVFRNVLQLSFFFVIIFSLHGHQSDKEYKYIKIAEKHPETIRNMEFIEIECECECSDSSEIDPALQKSTSDEDEFINESSNDSYESSFIDDGLSNETLETESSEEKTDVVRIFFKQIFFTDFFFISTN